MPELGHLRTFVAVAEERNFTRAAARLHVAQQAVSKSVAALEAELGVVLLRRTTRDVELTVAGAELLRLGRQALLQVDAAFSQAAAYGRALTGTVRIGVTPAVGAAAHPRIAAALTDDAPGLRVAFGEHRPAAAAALLDRRELDLVVSRVRPSTAGVATAELTATPATVLVAPGHRLAGRGTIRVAELTGERLQMWGPPGAPYTDDVVARLAAAGAAVEVVLATVQGSSGPPGLAADEFAIRPAGWPTAGTVELGLTPPGVALPLWASWVMGAAEPLAERLIARIGRA